MSEAVQSPRRFVFTEQPHTEEGWVHIEMPWNSQILHVSCLNRIHVAIWALLNVGEPPQDRYFIHVPDGCVLPEIPNGEVRYIKSCESQGVGIHVFEVIKR